MISEKSRGQTLVTPIMVPSSELCASPPTIISGRRLDIDPELGKVGECDLILAATDPVPPVGSPFATVVQARRDDVGQSLGPYVARMTAVRRFNEASGEGDEPVFGCMTTGEIWQFLQWMGSSAVIDRRRSYLGNDEGIVGVIREVIARALEVRSRIGRRSPL